MLSSEITSPSVPFLVLKQGAWVGMAPWDWVLSLASGELAEEQ